MRNESGQECYDIAGAPRIGTKWIDINKGDEDKYDIRSRVVAQEYSQGKVSTIFAATPPLEAKKALPKPCTAVIGRMYFVSWTISLVGDVHLAT